MPRNLGRTDCKSCVKLTAERNEALAVKYAAQALFDALDHTVPGWRDDTIADGDEVNAAWCALEASLRAGTGGM